ncbi:hypothetical protein MKZ38_008215 [Zalerion maritima]|uniref:Nucleolar complex protein 2 n=1 Tax=Zalerion maritima TaxID=339359 RepID=A0AAD5RGW9_9PEZI|nr:hypothetical protein MKZ38_008215 [Zalerion maritima]
MAKTKSTKKFEKTHLKGALEKRKSVAKLKQRHQALDKKKAKKARDAEFSKGPEAVDGAKPKSNKREAAVAEMSVDEFFGGGFDDIINAEVERSKKTPGKLGKRKRAEGNTAVAPTTLDLLSDGDEASDSGLSAQEDMVVASDSEADAQNGDLDVGMNQKAMDDLAKQDPDFYNFLKENDPEALAFDADLNEVDELSAAGSDEADEPPKKKKKKTKKSKQALEEPEPFIDENELTAEKVSKWKNLLEEQNSLRAAKEVVLAFRSAAHLNEDEDDPAPHKYTINSPDVYNDILVLALKQIPNVIQYHIPIKESASGKVHFQADGKKFRNLTNLLKSYTASALHLLGTLSDDNTLKVTISALTPILPYLLSFRKLLKVLIKTVVSFWARPASSDSTRITAFLVLRRLVVLGDKGVRESTLKAVYQGLLQGSRTTNSNTIKGINLMKNSAAELWGIDQQIGYTTAFTSIRQLAIHLRNSIVHNKNESYKQVYNWQYVHALDFWSCVLAEHCNPLKEAEAGKESLLRPLIFPCVQVTIGAMRLIPSSTYFPLRFLLYRSLLRISRATGTFIPLAPFLLEVLESAEMKKPAKSTTKVSPLDFGLNFKAQKAYVKTRVYQDGVGEQVVELLSEFFYLHCTNIAFPELALPVIIMLKRWLKQNRKKSSGNGNRKVESNIVILVQRLEANSKFIEEKRAKVEFAPKDRSQVEAFLRDFELGQTPVGAFVESQRTLRKERTKEEEEAREEERKRRERVEKEEKRQEDDDGFSGFEDEEEDDDEADSDIPRDIDMEGVDEYEGEDGDDA